jgi:hypothetical protein
MKARQTAILFLAGSSFALAIFWGGFSAATLAQDATPLPTPLPGRQATSEEVAQAMQEWSQSAHADTYDEGMGANTTCARCKAPQNWDPYNFALAESLDCASCKRVPGAPRPELESGVPIPESEWMQIGCEVCHQPLGDSVSTSLAFWNQALGAYEAVGSSAELCARCHEGQHGFEVTREQAESTAHQGWECTRCHGPHGNPVLCSDCHDPAQGPGAKDHARHPGVDCTACHDAGGLTIWQEVNPTSRHYGMYIPVRFAHALTSWPSHNLQREVRCVRCHHPLSKQQAPLVETVGCEACHADGAAFFWCNFFPRDPDPHSTPAEGQ